MRFYIIVAIAGLGCSEVLLAATTTHICKNGSRERRVLVTTEQTGKVGSCSVSYIKEGDPEGAPGKVLWQSAHDSSFCGPKAEGFIQKLTTMNFICSPENSAPAATLP